MSPDRLPSRMPLGPKIVSETPFVAGGPKANKRVIGAAQSAMRASRPDAIPASVKRNAITEQHIDQHAASQVSEILQNGMPISDRQSQVDVQMLEGQTYVLGEVKSRIEDVLGLEPVIEPEAEVDSLEQVRDVENTAYNISQRQEIFDYLTTATDLRSE